MPYAPSVNDNSGQILAQGINQGIAQLAQGLERNMAERKKKEEDRKAKEAVTSAGKALYGEAFDLKDAPKEDWGKIIQLSQAKQEEPLRQLQMENAQLRQKIDLAQFEQLARDRSAVTSAFNPAGNLAPEIQGGASFEQLPTAAPQDMQGMVMQAARNGASPQTLAQLANMADNLAQAQQRTAPKAPWSPTIVDLGGGNRSMMTSPNSAVPLHKQGAPAPRSALAKLMADRNAATNPEDRAKFDQAIAETVAAREEKPLTVNEFMMSPALSAKYKDDYGEYRKDHARQLGKPQPGAAASTEPTRVRVKLSDLK